MGIAVALLAVALVISNIYATRLVLREDTYEPSQKYCQIAIIWLIPILGFVFVCLVIISDTTDAKPLRRGSKDAGFYVDGGVDVSRSASTESLDGE